jgi:hypothetical protein
VAFTAESLLNGPLSVYNMDDLKTTTAIFKILKDVNDSNVSLSKENFRMIAITAEEALLQRRQLSQEVVASLLRELARLLTRKDIPKFYLLELIRHITSVLTNLFRNIVACRGCSRRTTRDTVSMALTIRLSTLRPPTQSTLSCSPLSSLSPKQPKTHQTMIRRWLNYHVVSVDKPFSKWKAPLPSRNFFNKTLNFLIPNDIVLMIHSDERSKIVAFTHIAKGNVIHFPVQVRPLLKALLIAMLRSLSFLDIEDSCIGIVPVLSHPKQQEKALLATI